MMTTTGKLGYIYYVERCGPKRVAKQDIANSLSIIFFPDFQN